MTSIHLLYLFISGVSSLIIVLFIYGYQSKLSAKAKWIYGTLRFISIFSILLLLINPKFKKETFSVKKPNLPILLDNSASIKELKQSENMIGFLSKIENHQALNDKFEISYYSFGNNFEIYDSLSLDDKNSNITKALLETNQLYNNTIAPIVLLSDGNQTLGKDYEFISSSLKNPVYPLILGDSTKQSDIRIEELNANRYAYLKNNFPVEIIIVYEGENAIETQLEILQENNVVYKKDISLSKTKNTKTINFTLPANSVGIQKYRARINPLLEEKNTTNNEKQFAIEIIDQATNVLIISSINHPDIGALSKAIISNKQRTVEVLKPAESLGSLNDYQLIVLYQPNQSFAAIYNALQKLEQNTFTFTGLQTDWNFLNRVQNNFAKEVTPQIENVECKLNENYGSFTIEDIGFNDFRPLKTLFGELEVLVQHEMVLEQSIDGFTTEASLLATMDINGSRNAIFDGEGFWRWRAQSYLQGNSFEEFDEFIGKLVQYLASNIRKSRLTVSSESFYYNNKPIKVTAQYFDENYIFDPRKGLKIKVNNSDSSESYEYPMLLKNNFFEVDLNNLPEGEYNFSVSDNDGTVSRSGTFNILEFNVEKQFLNANVTKLSKLATNTNGEAYFIFEETAFFNSLLENNNYQSIQQKEVKITPLVDWKYLLALIILTLSIEWFLRKYNGLI